jgi:glycosyltransferase involved in cell wall biosynthesis
MNTMSEAGTRPEVRTTADDRRLSVRGKFLYRGDEKFYVRGVTYGTFGPDASGEQFPRHDVVERDFAMMRSAGINAVRTYTPPPRWLLDLAHRHHIYVMVGVPWPQHITFLDDPAIVQSIYAAVRSTVSRCAAHPALLAFAIGNEIPASIVRWYGRERIERFLEKLYRIARSVDATTPITYVNFPTTEYLNLSFLDFVAFNVYLEEREKLADYLARLQNIAGNRPLVMAEIGLDSRRNGLEAQATSIEWQVRTAFEEGCAGAFVFAWTDEWNRGGYDVDDWDFGLTTRERAVKPALAALERVYRATPPVPDDPPMISVVVCSYNGAQTIGECLEGIARLDYPRYEVIVVDDGSRDTTAEIARGFECARLISIPNGGLSNARNVGWQAARGEIVAYIDDDATPDPDWLTYLAIGYRSGTFAGMGGPNIQPLDDDPIAHCVASAPGGPIHVLVGDRIAEHIPGCNMSFRRRVLEEIGGFDTQFTIAGDDVDICWRVQERGYEIGFHAGAMVWHHRRNRIRIYWRQQVNYGRAEAMLEHKWPEKYNRAGHASWSGRLYGNGHRQFLGWRRGRVYQGVWGAAPFQSEEAPEQTVVAALPLMPEWHLLIAALSAVSLLGLFWTPLLAAVPLALAAIGIVVTDAVLGGLRACVPAETPNCWRCRAITSLLYFLQPLARLVGRSGFGLTPWRVLGARMSVPIPRQRAVWSERWATQSDRVASLADAIRASGGVTTNGGPYDRWDLSVRGGLVGSARMLVAVEEHGAGRQFVRFAVRAVASPWALVAVVLLAALAGTAWQPARGVALVFATLALATTLATLAQCAAASGLANEGIDRLERRESVAVTDSSGAGRELDAHRNGELEELAVEAGGRPLSRVTRNVRGRAL